MNFPQTNVNDNRASHRLYGNKADHLPYVPAARYLIDRYVSTYWKNDIHDTDFIAKELTLCGNLKMAAEHPSSRKLVIKWVARELNISPIRLLNDPSLPF